MTQHIVTAKLPSSWKKAMEDASESQKRKLSRYLRQSEESYDNLSKEKKSKIKNKWAYIAKTALKRYHGKSGKTVKHKMTVSHVELANQLVAIAKMLVQNN